MSDGDLPAMQFVFLFLQVLVFVMACGGNAFVVLVITKYIKRQSLTNRFIINLSVADMFTGLAALSQVVYTFVPSLNANFYTCLLRYQIVMLMTLTSQLTVTFTTFDRYIAICHPIRYPKIMAPRTANIMILVSWLYSAVITLMPIVGLTSWRTSTPCLFQLLVSPWQLLWMALTLWIFTIITTVLYGFILRKAWKMHRQIRPAGIQTLSGLTQQTNGSNDMIGAVNHHNQDFNRRMTIQLRGAKTLAVVTLLFSICWLPYTYFLLRAFVDPAYLMSAEWMVANWVVFLGVANSVMNPFIYAWQRRDFNEASRILLGCKRSNRNQHV